MAIQTIPQILINGSNQAYGGYIYNASLNLAKITDPAEVRLSFVNENKVYTPPNLNSNYIPPNEIQIGDVYADTFYAIEYKIDDSSQGKILEVTYWNGTLILDKFWVGLYKKMGDPSDPSTPNSLIIVGKEIHPCDINEDGVFDELDYDELIYDKADPCEFRCPNELVDGQQILLECWEKFVTQLFDVEYSFNDLIGAIQNKGIPLGTIPAQTNPKFLARYTGKLKSVLDSWCSDLGWTYYFEFGKLNFIDVRVRPLVVAQNFNNIKTQKQQVSLKGTLSRGFITYYAEPGVLAPICPSSRPYQLNCLTLKELFGDYYTPNSNIPITTQNDLAASSSGGSDLTDQGSSSTNVDLVNAYQDDIFTSGVPIEDFETSCVFSFYNENLRNMNLLFNYYQADDDTGAATLIGKKLDRLGQMTILEVFSPNRNPTQYNQFLNGKLPGGGQIFSPTQPTAKNNFTAQGGYFALVIYDNNLLKKQFDIEQRLAREFIGVHWMQPFTDPYLGEHPQITPHGTYYSALSTEAYQIPFAQFNHTADSYVGSLLATLTLKQANNFRVYNSQRYNSTDYTTAQLSDTNDNSETAVLRSFVYMAKNTVWTPTPVDSADFKNVMNSIPYMTTFGVDYQVLQNMLGPSGADIVDFTSITTAQIPNVALVAFYPGSINVSGTIIDNPAEENPFYKHDVPQYSVASYGLSSKSTYQITVNGFPIFMPVSSSVNQGEQPLFNDGVVFNSGGAGETTQQSIPYYTVIISITSKNRGLIPKVQTTYTTAPPNVDSTLEVDYQVKDINRKSLKYFLAPLVPQCSVDTQVLMADHQDLNVNLNYSVTVPFSTFEYEIAGLDISQPVSIANGLQNMQISISNNEITTQLKISDSLFKPQSQDYLLHQFIQDQSEAINNGRPSPFGPSSGPTATNPDINLG